MKRFVRRGSNEMAFLLRALSFPKDNIAEGELFVHSCVGVSLFRKCSECKEGLVVIVFDVRTDSCVEHRKMLVCSKCNKKYVKSVFTWPVIPYAKMLGKLEVFLNINKEEE